VFLNIEGCEEISPSLDLLAHKRLIVSSTHLQQFEAKDVFISHTPLGLLK